MNLDEKIISELKTLHMTAFNEDVGYFDYFVKNVIGDKSDNVFYAERDGRAVSALYVIDKTVVRAGKSVPAAFISGVATMPEYRGRGLAREVVAAAVGSLKKRGVRHILLCPFDEAFYAKLGFTTVSKSASFADVANFERVPITLNDTDELEQLHKIIGGEFYLSRTAYEFAHRINELAASGERGYFLCKNGEKIGYIFGGESDYEIAVAGVTPTVPFGMAYNSTENFIGEANRNGGFFMSDRF